MRPAAVQTNETVESLQEPSFVGGSVYFIEAVGANAIKIGWARSPERRMMLLNTGCPHDLRLIASVPGCLTDEGYVHRHFAADRVRGEWYRPTDRLSEVIQFVKREGRLPPAVFERVPKAPKPSTGLVLDTEALRQRLGNMSQAAFAQIAYVDQSSVSLWETNRNVPRRAVVALILKHCSQHKIKPQWKPAPATVPA